MTRLSSHESGLAEVDRSGAKLTELQERLYRAQVAHIVHGRRAIVMFEGWDAGGKGGTIRRLCEKWDPRYFEVYPISAPTAPEKNRHFLWRFWTRIPANRNISVFDRSWYGRVLVERVEGFASEAEWRRAYDEINAFEAEQVASGTPVIKIFLHVTQAEQDRRFADRLNDPWKRWKTGPDDYRNRARRDDYLAAMEDMFARTDTAAAPWFIVDANRKGPMRLAVLEHIAERLEANAPSAPPPADPDVEALARGAFGYSPR